MDKFEIRNSKTGHPIPVINEIHLHSTYNPIKEAQQFMQKQEGVLKKKNNILILGLAFGYHIEQAINRLNRLYNDYWQILVIEPNQKTFDEIKKLNLFELKNTTIVCESNIEVIYRNDFVINFLADGPGLISHPASFNLYSNFFKAFLSYRAGTKLRNYLQEIKHSPLKDFLSEFPQDLDLGACLKLIKDSSKLTENPMAFSLLAFEMLTSSKK